MVGILVDEVQFRFFNPLFAVSRCGKVLRKLTPFKPHIRADGYLAVSHYLLHRMVAICWLEKPPLAKIVHHLNEDKTDNRAENLEWLTQKVHIAERHKNSRGPIHWSEASRERMRILRTGVKDSPEVRRKKQEMLDIIRPRCKCEVHGVQYPSIRKAAIILKAPVTTVRLRCLSKNFPEYKLV